MSTFECVKIDPMKNDLVLQRILGFCDVPSLKNCRLVSSKWRDLSLYAWREKAVIWLGPNGRLKIDEFLNYIDSEKGSSDPLQLGLHPFKRYNIEFTDCEQQSQGGGRYSDQLRVAELISSNGHTRSVKFIWNSMKFHGFTEFLSRLNPDSLEALKVMWHTLNETVPAIESMNLVKFSNLKRLGLFTKLYRRHSGRFSLSAYLLNSFPNLESLCVAYVVDNKPKDSDYPVCLADRKEIVTLLKTLRQSGGETEDILPLKEFEMIDVLSNQKKAEHDESSIVHTLAQCNFPLTRLIIHVGYSGNAEIPILPLLESCKDTLQYLKTSINFNSSFFSNASKSPGERVKADLKPVKCGRIVSLPKLKEINLLNGLDWAMFLLAHLHIPQLEKLTVDYDKGRNHEKRRGLVSVKFPQEKVFERMKTFELNDSLIIPEEKTIIKFAEMMPNLAHLTIPLDKSTFRLVCNYFRGLKTLNVLIGKGEYAELDDETLTGVPLDQKRNQLKPRPPNITDLKQLSDLSISCEKQLLRDDVKFTEHSVIYGFLQLPKLFNLSIAFKKLSDEMKEKLLKHVKGKVDFQKKVEPSPDSYAVEIVSEDENELSEEIENDECN